MRACAPLGIGTALSLRRWARHLLLAGSAGLWVAACQGDGLAPQPPIERNALYWALDLNHHAVTLSLKPRYDTLTLVATPRTVDGTALTGLPAAQYVSRNPEVVAVTPEGALQAVTTTAAGQLVTVVATLTAGNLKHTDSLVVKVVEDMELPVLGSFSIHPVPPDSAKAGPIAASGGGVTPTCFNLPTVDYTALPPFVCTTVHPVTVLDTTGAPIPNVPVSIRSSDPGTMTVDSFGRVVLNTSVAPGSVNLYGSTTVFGVSRADTLPFRVGLPLANGVVVGGFSQTDNFPQTTIGTGGIVFWTVDFGVTLGGNVDITFADPTNVLAVNLDQPESFFVTDRLFLCVFTGAACVSGDGNFVLDGSLFPRDRAYRVLRRFPLPGVYEYHSDALGGMRGRIVVVDESSP